jgi:hypothetical protein
MLGVCGVAFGAWGVLGAEELACPVDDVMVLMAPMVATPAAEALVFRSSRRLAAVGPAVFFCALAAAGEQLWSAGKRCEAQNCSLHFYRRIRTGHESRPSVTHSATNGGKQSLPASGFSADRGSLGLRLASHHRTIFRKVSLHCDIGVLACAKRDGHIA